MGGEIHSAFVSEGRSHLSDDEEILERWWNGDGTGSRAAETVSQMILGSQKSDLKIC